MLWLRLALTFGIPPGELQERLTPQEFREYQAMTDFLFPLEDGWRQSTLVASAMTTIKDREAIIPIRRFRKDYTQSQRMRDVNAMAALMGIK